MKPASVDIPVHDIAPLLEIHEHSMVWFMLLVMCTVAVVFMFFKKMRTKESPKQLNERKRRYENFIHIDVSDPKKAAYAICEQGSFFAQDNEQTKSAYKTLFESLEPYKYAPKVEPITEECLALYRGYCQMVVV